MGDARWTNDTNGYPAGDLDKIGAVKTRGPIYHDITFSTAMTATEIKSDFKLTTDTPFLALTGKLWVSI